MPNSLSSPAQERAASWPETAVQLWRRIRSHDLDVTGDDFSFTRRLARDNQWTEEFAQVAVEEYRRFAFLAVVCEHPVTPSDQVDQVWHLHLLYTRDYWQVFCPDVLQREFHHGPTRGGPQQGELFVQQYARTRHSYREWFGEYPPVELWPGSEERFGRDTQWVRVNLDEYRLVPRARGRNWVPRAARRIMTFVETLRRGK